MNQSNTAGRVMRMVGCAAMLAASAVRAQTVDQSSTGSGILFSQIALWTGQSFTTPATELIGGGFYLFGTGGTAGQTIDGTLTVSLYAGPRTDGFTPLASSSVAFTVQSGAFTWVDAFWAPVGVSAFPGPLYLYAEGTASPPQTTAYTMASTGGYASGLVTSQTGANFAEQDAAFRTWKPTPILPPSPDPDPSTTVPEPGTYALVSLGVALLYGVRRRRMV
jgi:hypothetical protein